MHLSLDRSAAAVVVAMAIGAILVLASLASFPKTPIEIWPNVPLTSLS